MADEDLTRLLIACREGDETARDRLFESIYRDLQDIARRRPGVGKSGDTLQPTALVNEASIQIMRRFEGARGLDVRSRQEFFMLMAFAMRSILKDHFRSQRALKRGGGRSPMAGRSAERGQPDPDSGSAFDEVDFLALDEAIDRLEAYNERWYRVVMHRFFGDRTVEETAELLGLGVTAVKRDWRFARAWLLREVRGGDGADG